MARYEVCFTVYEDASQSSYDSNLFQVTQIIDCFQPQQAQAMVEAQYGNRVHVHYVRNA